MKKNGTWWIIFKNVFTLFNLVNIVLAAMVAFVGSYKNMLFIFVAIANTLISIVNELRAKRIVDKMRLLSEKRPVILKNGVPTEVNQAEVQKNDILVLSLGDQVMYDGVIREGFLEVNEAFITGEQENIPKRVGDKITSGSFVVSGSAEAVVENVAEENFVNKLQSEASNIKTADSKLFSLMNNIVKYISYALIPIGALLLWSRFRTEGDTTTAVTSTVAALINMIPEGLILLTSSVLALATIRLSRRKVLVQDLYAIETLARVDTIALDKTGTLTTGNMTVKDLILPDGTVTDDFGPTGDKKPLLSALEAILSNIPIDNATSSALKKTLMKKAKNDARGDFPEITDVIPFSSERKCSGVKFKGGQCLMGAIEFLTDDKKLIKTVKTAAEGCRTIAVIKNDKFLGAVRLEDEIRPTASAIIKYFDENDIDVKIISGDDLEAVQSIAKRVGMKELSGIDLSSEKNHNYAKLARKYGIFSRVTPSEKKELILALKKQGRTVAMTGDGVNDILAMKEADVSLAIGEGSDAARRVAKFVLLDSGFEAVPSIVDEGRQSINNLERSTSLFLAKTVYAGLLAVLFVVLPLSYPFTPIEMTLLNFACIGLPGLILALEHNTERIKDKFMSNIMTYSVPIGITVAIAMVALAIVSEVNSFTRQELTTASVIVTFAIDLLLIYWVSRPLNFLRGGLLMTIVAILLLALLVPVGREFFEFELLSVKILVPIIIIVAVSVAVFLVLMFAAKKIRKK